MFCIYLLVMPKYWGKQIFTHGRFPEVGEKQKAQKKEKEKKKKLGENNGQLRFVRHHGWRTQTRLDQKKQGEKEREREDRKSVLTMVSTYAWTNNGYACEHHRRWRTQTAWTNKLFVYPIYREDLQEVDVEKKVRENNGQLHIQGSRLDQKTQTKPEIRPLDAESWFQSRF